MRPEDLSIDGSLFWDLRDQMSAALRGCMARMHATGMKEGSVGVKINIEIVGDEPMPIKGRDMVQQDVLKIDSKVTMCVPMKWEEKIDPQIGIKCIVSPDGFRILPHGTQITVEEILNGEDQG